MKGIIDAIKNNKRIFFCTLAVCVAVANHFGYADYELDANISVIIAAGVPLLLSLLRKYLDV